MERDPGERPFDRREALLRLEEIRRHMAKAGEYRHLSGAAAIGNGVLVLAACAVSRWLLGVSFSHGDDPVRLAAAWGPVAALGLAVDVWFTVALARGRGESAWSPAARQLVGGLLPGLLAGAILTAFLFDLRHVEALPGAWMVCYGAALMGASLFAPWEVRWAGLSFLAAGALSLLLFRARALEAMAAGFGGIHLLFGLYVLARYPR